MITKAYSKQERGFTLVELAVILIIMGLVLVAILVGRDLLISAKLRSVTVDRHNFMASVNTFYLKYNYLPGDF